MGAHIAAILLLTTLAGCSAGAIYPPTGAPGGGPHPHVAPAWALHVGPVELLHAPVSNSDPVTDLTVLTVNAGPKIGPIHLTAGLGWQVSRTWTGPCDAEGFHCGMAYPNGWTAAAGASFKQGIFRADLRAFAFDNSPVGADSPLPLGIEALVLLFGFQI